MALDNGILAGMTALTKISCPGLVGSFIAGYPRKAGHF